jgi:hypothetical protein
MEIIFDQRSFHYFFAHLWEVEKIRNDPNVISGGLGKDDS